MFKYIFYLLPLFIWSETTFKERIINHTTSMFIPFSNNLPDVGVSLKTNRSFISYTFFSQVWISSNLAVYGKIAPYVREKDIYQYKSTGVHYRFLNDLSNISQFNIKSGIHSITDKSNLKDENWFNFSIYFNKIFKKNEISFNWNNYFTKNQTIKSIGIIKNINFFQKFTINFGITHYISFSKSSINLTFGYSL